MNDKENLPRWEREDGPGILTFSIEPQLSRLRLAPVAGDSVINAYEITIMTSAAGTTTGITPLKGFLRLFLDSLEGSLVLFSASFSLLTAISDLLAVFPYLASMAVKGGLPQNEISSFHDLQLRVAVDACTARTSFQRLPAALC